MATVRELLERAGDLPTDSPRRDAEILLCHCLEKTRTWLYTWPEQEVPEGAAGTFDRLLARRRAGEPVAYLTGQREFWSLQLRVSAATLIPRPETESLVNWALQLDLPDVADVVDLGTGTGAIALALAAERPDWRVTGVDISEAALAVARDNGRRAGLARVAFLQSHWLTALAGNSYHLLVANPPYIDAADPHLERGDVKFEPRGALVAAEQGLADLRHLVGQAPAQLVDGGWLLLEHGCTQGAAVRALFERAGYSDVATRRDLAGQERITGGRWRAQ